MFLNWGGGDCSLFLDHVGSYVPIRLVKLSEIQREVEEIIGNSDLDGAAFSQEMEAPVGFRDNDDAPANVVDLKKLAGADGDATPRGDDRNDVWKHAVRRPEKAEDEASDAGSATPRPPDLRVCYIDMDDTGTRYKEWRKVILESKTVTYADVPLDGPLSALNWCRHTHRFGGNPRLWFTEFARSKGIHSTDRVYHELSTLVDAVYHGGTYDQFNLGCSICIEVISRRIQSIVDA